MSLPHLVLIGAGHANIQVLARYRSAQLKARCTLVSDVPFAPYSGMLPGFLAGLYQFSELHFDLRALAHRSGVEFVEQAAVSLSENGLVLADGTRLSFDLASLNVGIRPALGELEIEPGADVVALKPVARLLDKWSDFLSRVGPSPRLAFVGGGAAGLEVAVAAYLRLTDLGSKPQITVFQPEPILRGHCRRAQSLMRERLSGLGIALVPDRIGACRVGELQGRLGRYAYDTAFLASQASAPEWLATGDLPLQEGFVETDRQLRVRGSQSLLAAGDCIAFPDPLPKAGVYAVRQGAILAQNVERLLQGRPLLEYRPQKSALALLHCGPREVLVSKGWIAFTSSWALAWKRWIDTRFMKKFS